MTFFDITDDGPVRRLTFRRPDTKNAIPPDGWAQLAAAFDDFAEAGAAVLVISGEGGDFSSGAYLSDDADLSSTAANLRRMRGVSATVTRLHRLPKPTIAVVDGVAYGAGMNLALGCDIVLATERARFSEVFVRRGLALDAGGTWLLPRLVGMMRARELALTGRVVEAAEAAAIGLVTELVAVEDLEASIGRYLDALGAGAPLAQRFIKTGLDRSSAMTFEEALAWEDQSQAILLATDDFAEGVAAFLERRNARFGGS